MTQFIIQRPNVQMDTEKEKHLTSLLATIRWTESNAEIPDQPSQSYQNISDDEDAFLSRKSDSHASRKEAVESHTEYEDWEDRTCEATCNPYHSRADSQGVDTSQENHSYDSSEWNRTSYGSTHSKLPASSAEGTTTWPSHTQSSSVTVHSDSDSDCNETDDNQQLENLACENEPGEQCTIKDEDHEMDDEEDDQLLMACADLLEYNKDTMSDFMLEFRAHNAANRISNDSLLLTGTD